MPPPAMAAGKAQGRHWRSQSRQIQYLQPNTSQRHTHTHREPLQPNQLRNECRNLSKTGLGGRHLLQTPMLCATGCSGLCALLACTGHTGWMGAPPQHSHQSWLCRAQPQSQGAGTVLAGSLTHSHTQKHTCTIYPPTRQASRMEFSQKKATPPSPTKSIEILLSFMMQRNPLTPGRMPGTRAGGR